MRIGVLETGFPPGDLGRDHGSYAEMMARLLGPGFVTVTFDVQAGELPDRPEEFDGYLVTGSPAGVYDELPWIAPLADFLRQARGKAKLVGICFGHQIMAEAFGGKVVKSDKGWGLGLHAYDVQTRAPWMDGDAGPIAIPVSHQDQVVAPPPGAQVIAGSPFTPYGVLAYDDDAISFQCHPEFAPDYACALLEHRRPFLPPAEVETALTSLGQEDDRERVSAWIRRFFLGGGPSTNERTDVLDAAKA